MTTHVTYVLDTSTIAYDSHCYKGFKDSTVIIPIPVLEELDKIKKLQDEAGKNARTFLRTIDQIIRNSGQKINVGIKLDDGITIKVDTDIVNNDTLGSALYGDNRILSYVMQLVKSKTRKVVLVTKDIALRVRASAYGIVAEDYTKSSSTLNNIENNDKALELTDDEVNLFYKHGMLDIPDEVIGEVGLKANNFVTLRSYDGEDVGHARYNADAKAIRILSNMKNVFGLSSRNLEQAFALDLLLDNDVKLVTLSGSAGTGKTLLALAAGLYGLLESPGKRYEKLMIMKPITSVGKEVGTLPGTLEEKLSPFLSSYYDNLSVLLRGKNKDNRPAPKMDPYLSLMMENGKIEIEAIAYLRGRSLPNAFIIIDEIQNISMHELKTILTRAGEGSKIVLIGDESQIDAMNLSSGSNGLATAMSKFADYQIAGSVQLTKGERSALATLAASIL